MKFKKRYDVSKLMLLDMGVKGKAGQCWARKMCLGAKKINLTDFTNGSAFFSVYN